MVTGEMIWHPKVGDKSRCTPIPAKRYDFLCNDFFQEPTKLSTDYSIVRVRAYTVMYRTRTIKQSALGSDFCPQPWIKAPSPSSLSLPGAYNE